MAKHSANLTNIRLTPQLRNAIDHYTQELGLNVSELCREALRHYIRHLKLGMVADETLEELADQKLSMSAVLCEAIKGYAWESTQAIKQLRTGKPSEKDIEEAQKLEARQPTPAEEQIRKISEEG